MRVISSSFFARLSLILGCGLLLIILQQGNLDGPIRDSVFWSLRPGLAAARAYSETFATWRFAAEFVREGGSRLAAAEAELARHRVELEQVRVLEKENGLLRVQLGRVPDDQAVFRFYGGGGEWFVDGGCRQGVKDGAPVYFAGSLLGQVTRAQAGFSEVQTILSQDFRQPVKIGSGSASGLFQNSRGAPEIQGIPLRSGVTAGDMVSTRGLGAILPDLPLGRVGEVSADGATGVVTAELIPFFTPAQAEWVWVPVVDEGERCAD